MKTRGLVHFGATLVMSAAAGLACAAGNATVSVSATVLSKNQCKLSGNSATLSFGNIDPSGVAAATASTTIDVTCNGAAKTATFSITRDSGLYSTGPNANRMRHATLATEYLPYSFAVSPASATIAVKTAQTVTISGSILAGDYSAAYVGSYSDSVVITVNP